MRKWTQHREWVWGSVERVLHWETKIPSQKVIIKRLKFKIIKKGAVLIRYLVDEDGRRFALLLPCAFSFCSSLLLLLLVHHSFMISFSVEKGTNAKLQTTSHHRLRHVLSPSLFSSVFFFFSSFHPFGFFVVVVGSVDKI